MTGQNQSVAGQHGQSHPFARRVQPADSRPLMQLLTPLTDREREVVLLFLQTPNDKQVAMALDTQLQTIRNHMASVLRKLEVARQQLPLLYRHSDLYQDGLGQR